MKGKLGLCVALLMNHVCLSQTIQDVAKEIKKQDIRFPKTSLAIAAIESGQGKSKVFKNKLNAFGLKGKNGNYMRFQTIEDCVARFKITHDKIVERFHPKTELQFLDSLRKWGYAEDTRYKEKIHAAFNYSKKLLKLYEIESDTITISDSTCQ